MKHLLRFSLFEEVNPKDIAFIETMDQYFTVSFEFEIETDDLSNIKINYNYIYDDDIVDDIISSVIEEMNANEEESEMIEDLVYSFIDTVEQRSLEGEVDISFLKSIFEDDVFENDRKNQIAFFTKSVIMSQIIGDDLPYMKRMFKKNFPNFNKKWKNDLDFVLDPTLDRGIEVKPKTYLSGLSDSIEMIEDFYNDLNNQDYWKFSPRTGLHINIGTNSRNIEWNPIKGLLMMNDFNEGVDTPYVFKDMTWRFNNKFCGSLIPSIKNMNNVDISELKSKIDLNDIKSAENILNNFLIERLNHWGHKNFGFNLTKLDLNYVEFRYVGGEISKDVLIEKLKYFSFIVYVMTNPEYKRKEYLKKLYKFVDNL